MLLEDFIEGETLDKTNCCREKDGCPSRWCHTSFETRRPMNDIENITLFDGWIEQKV